MTKQFKQNGFVELVPGQPIEDDNRPGIVGLVIMLDILIYTAGCLLIWWLAVQLAGRL